MPAAGTDTRSRNAPGDAVASSTTRTAADGVPPDPAVASAARTAVVHRRDVGRRWPVVDRRVELHLGRRQRAPTISGAVGAIGRRPVHGLDRDRPTSTWVTRTMPSRRAVVLAAREHERLVADRVAQAVHEAGVDLPAGRLAGHRERRGDRDGSRRRGTGRRRGRRPPAGNSSGRCSSAVRSTRERTVASSERYVVREPSTSSESSEGDGEGAAVDVADAVLLGRLVGAARRQRDVRRARGPPVVEGAGRNSVDGRAAARLGHDVAVARARPRRAAGTHARGRANGSRVPPPRVAAVEDGHDVGAARRDFGDQQRRAPCRRGPGAARRRCAGRSRGAGASGSARSARGRRSPPAPAPRCRGRRRRTGRRPRRRPARGARGTRRRPCRAWPRRRAAPAASSSPSARARRYVSRAAMSLRQPYSGVSGGS